jgi:Secretion system C-terminal sorting domain
MKNITTAFMVFLCALTLNSQTTWQVCISEVYSAGACNSTSGVFTPGSLTLEVGDQIQFTTYMVLLGGYNGTHDIQFAGSPANNVMLPISTNVLAPMTTVTTPPFTSAGSFSMECMDGNHCLIADLMEGWPCSGYQITVNAPCINPDVPILTTSSSICPGNTATIDIAGNLNDATDWVIYEGSCGGVPVGSTQTNSIVAAPAITTTYYIQGNGGCVTPGVCSTVTVTVEDLIPPVVICQDITVSLDGAGNATILPNDLDGGSSDNCGNVSFSASQTSFTCSDIGGGGSAVTLTVDDGNGNTSNCVSIVTVQDNIFPTASNPAAINVECSADIPAPDITVVTDEADNCTASPIVAFVSDVSNGNTCPEIITRTYSVVDDQGNLITVYQTITINDLTSPTASNPAAINVECFSDVPAPDVLVVIDENDNCTLTPVVAWVGDVSDGLTCPETITRTYSVTDDCGISVMVTQLITINDVTGPNPDTGSLADINEVCEATPSAPTATDNCSGASVGTPNLSFPITTIGTNVVTWTYTDICGNVSSQSQNVIISGLDVSVTQASEVLSSNNNVGVTYQWVDCNNGFSWIIGETAQVFEATLNGDYAVIVTHSLTGCSDTSACYTVNTISIDENNFASHLSLFPNPTNGKFTLQFGALYENVTLEIKNVAGQLIKTLKFTNVSEAEIDLDEAKGVYLLDIKIGNELSATMKVLKE